MRVPKLLMATTAMVLVCAGCVEDEAVADDASRPDRPRRSDAIASDGAHADAGGRRDAAAPVDGAPHDAAIADGASPVDAAGHDAAPVDDAATDGAPIADAGEADAAPAWDGVGPFPGPCRLEITGGAADLRIRWIYEGLQPSLARFDEGIDGVIEREIAWTYEEGAARMPCGAGEILSTPVADLALADPLPAPGVGWPEGCAADGLRPLPGERRVARQTLRIFAGGAVHDVVRTAVWDGRDRLVRVDQRLGQTVAPGFDVDNPYRLFEATYDAMGRLTERRVRASVLAVIDGPADVGLAVTRFAYAAGEMRATRTLDFAAGDALQVWRFDAAGHPTRMTADGLQRDFTYDAAGRLTRVESRRGGALVGVRTRSFTVDGQDRVVEMLESGGLADEALSPVRRATFLWHGRGNLSRLTFATPGAGAEEWVDGETWAYGYGCW